MSTVLKKENIIVNCKVHQKDDVLRMIGSLMVSSGYCTPAYVTGIFEKENMFCTYIGNGVAIPHGIEYVRDEVLNDGIIVVTSPDGIEWGNDNNAKLIIGIASKGDDHMSILGNIASICMNINNVDKLVNSSAEYILNVLGSTNVG